MSNPASTEKYLKGAWGYDAVVVEMNERNFFSIMRCEFAQFTVLEVK